MTPTQAAAIEPSEPSPEPPITASDIIAAACSTRDDLPSEKVFNTVNDLLFRVTDQSTQKEALIEAQGLVKVRLGLRHVSDARERGDSARRVLGGV